jgi:16S rRNA (cytosine1402-N4)-methyltransferase
VSPTLLHTPVLLDEVLDGLAVRAGGRYIDCTVGTGGHSEGILDRSGPGGRLLGLDVDPSAVEVSRRRLSSYSNRVILIGDSYARLKDLATAQNFVPADGVLLDLGLSSLQLEEAERGFSFQRDGPLDMRMDPANEVTASHLVNDLKEADLAHIIAAYGEEPKARAIARAIVRSRPVRTTKELADLVSRNVGRRRRLHPATRTFQALRIAVNEELDNLSATLPQIVEVLAEGGRMALISFHSLEDRLVKSFMVRETRGCICPPELPVCRCDHSPTLRILTRKPIRPSPGEIRQNPRARGAKLRIAVRI